MIGTDYGSAWLMPGSGKKDWTFRFKIFSLLRNYITGSLPTATSRFHKDGVFIICFILNYKEKMDCAIT